MATFTGTSGDDSLQGTQSADFFNVYQGGNDTVSGLGGNDIFNFGAAFTAADTVDGGSGSDTLELKGDYTTAVTLGATTLTSVEQIKVAAGFDYDFVFNDANVAAGATLTINAANLGAADSFTLDGSHETDGYFRLEGGAGNDVVSMGAAFRAQDRFDGGSGNDVVYVAGDFSFGFTNATLRNIDTLVLAGGHNYHFVTNDANVTAGATLNVDASELGAGDTLVFSGTHETDGAFTIHSNAALSELTGGAGADSFTLGASLTAADRINGGAGSDTLYIGGADYSLVLAHATLQSIENLKLAAGNSYDLTLGGSIASNATLVIDASGLTATDSLRIDAHKETAGSVIIDGGAAPATLIGTQQGDAFDFAVTGQGGFAATDTIDGQAGYDRLYLDGAYTGSHAVALSGSQVQNVEEFDFNAGNSYKVTIAAGTVAGLSVFTADASQLSSVASLTFNGSAATASTSLHLIGGAGADSLVGGAGNDVFDLTHGGTDAATGSAGDDTFLLGAMDEDGQTLNGGTGNDTVVLDGTSDGGIQNGHYISIETVRMTAGSSYQFESENVLPAGQTFTVDASALGPDNTLYYIDFTSSQADYVLIGGAGNDTLQADNVSHVVYDLSHGGEDTVSGNGSANDTTIEMGAALDAGDRLNGNGAGILDLNGDYTGAGAVSINSQTLSAFAKIVLEAGHDYDITYTSASAPATTVDASLLGAGDTATLDFHAVTAGMTIVGGAGNDVITGAAGITLDLSHGGNDTANAGGGEVDMGAAFDGNDALSDVGTLVLDGEYGPLDLTSTANLSATTLELVGNFDFNITVSSTQIFSTLTTQTDQTLTFDGSAETTNGFTVHTAFNSGATITGGGGNDFLESTSNGTEVLHGGGGNDTLETAFTTTSSGTDVFDGGAGNDTLIINATTNSLGTTMGLHTMTSIENLQVVNDINMNDGNVAAGQTLNVSVSGNDARFIGASETNGHFNITYNVTGTGGQIDAGALSDTITMTGTDGGTFIAGGGGADTITLSTEHGFVIGFGAVSDSTGVNYDTVNNANFHTGDEFYYRGGSASLAITGINTAITHGALSTATFDTDLTADMAGNVSAHHAVLFTPDSGTLAGHTFLIIDVNGVSGYQSGQDFVVDVTGFSGTISKVNFDFD